ncbi:Cobalt-precorrin-3B C(17)-methyltransferase [Hafnia alvei]|uniref:Cobalt-precorrin-3B C(17)-methyltransferase n=1 Tax=Hafnia alvei TaxID=569 RepID=A0A377PFL7_HAFAL|nr:Cobalt-precorrin-3B C(17)-methyltransferase [Hafnia alvei]
MLYVIGIGPGSQSMMTLEAIEAIRDADIIVGYKTYTPLGKSPDHRERGDQNGYV